ncbi:TetR/AcrR family transcriptional regulator [Streptomyces sp. JNUCC 64]
MDTSQQQATGGSRPPGEGRVRARGTDRSLTRRAELLAIGRKLFADTAYDALSMDDIARQAHVAKGLIYYYFGSKRGYYLAIIEDAVAGLVARSVSEPELPGRARLERTIDGYLRYAEHHQAAYRAIVTGGVGFDSEVHAIRDGVREAIVDTIAEGAYGRREIPRTARLALLGWQWSVEGITLDWIGGPGDPPRDTVRALLVGLLGSTLRTIEEFEPSCPAPPAEPG